MKIKKFLSIGLLVSLIGSPLVGCNKQFTDNSSNNNSESEISSNQQVSQEESKISSIAISNKTALQEKWLSGDAERKIKINIVAKGLTFDQAMAEGLISIVSSNPEVVKVTTTTLKAVSAGTATITVSAGAISDSVEITVSEKEYGVPTASFENASTSYSVISKQMLELPTLNAVDQDGVAIPEANISVVSDKDPFADITSTSFLSDVEGEHTLTYTITNPGDKSKSTTLQLTVNVCRDILKFKDGSIKEDLLHPNAEQKLSFTNEGETISTLNMFYGKNYYAEAEFSGLTGSEWRGFAHVPSDFNDGINRWLISSIRPSDKTTIFLDSKDWATASDRYHNNIDKTMGVTFTGNTIKYAVARIGEVFYAFVNDNYVGSYTSLHYANVDTVPGFFCNAYPNGDANVNIDITKIDFFSDKNKVEEKVNSLVGSSIIRPYSVRDDYWDYTPANFNIGKNETDGQYVEVLNDNVGQNANIWSPWTYFANDFTFEFDYTFESSSVAETAQNGRMWVELRGWDYDNPLVEFGAKYSMADPQFMMDQEQYCNAYGDSGDGVSKYNQPVWSSFGISKDTVKTLHYKIERKLVEATSTVAAHSVITMTISIPGGQELVTHTVKAYSSTGATQEILVSVQSKLVKGKFSNINWKNMVL